VDSRSTWVEEVASRSQSLFNEWQLNDLPSGLRRNNLDYYYLSVWPGLQDLEPVQNLRLPERPPTTEYAYIHIPFCSGLCDFCSYFLSVIRHPESDKRTDRYIHDLLTQARNAQALTRLSISYLYIGGGTPSLLSPDQLHRILDGLRQIEALTPELLGTMEFHPEAFEDRVRLQETLAVLSDFGIRRASLGYQSDDEVVLEANNRRHGADFLAEVVHLFHEEGFLINVDLMYGLPDQSLASWIRSLGATLDAAPDSISTYFTFVTFGTKLWRRVKSGNVKMSEHRLIQTQHIAASLALQDSGYHELPNDFYSIPPVDSSSFTQEGLPSESNSLALGAGAYGYYSSIQYFNHFNFRDYGDAVSAGLDPIWRAKVLTPTELLARDIMFSFKNAPCLNRTLFRARHGVDLLDHYPEKWELLTRLSLVAVDKDEIRLTPKGRLIVEEIACLFARESHSGFRRNHSSNLTRRHHYASTYDHSLNV
jgi:oxygen-independent coproporphyrinogen III oxidase